jgi:phosphonate transport system substrate-binding protein
MNPYQVLLAQTGEAYVPLVRDIGRKLFGVIVVRKDSSIQSVKELDGKIMAFPAPTALGASLLTRSDMQNLYNTRVRPRFVLSHSSVYLNVALGHTIAGGGVQKTLNQQPANIKNVLRVLHKTTEVAPHPFTAHPRVPKKVQDKVRNALLAMGQTPEGKALLAKIPIKKIGSSSIKDYQALSGMGLEHHYGDR